MINHRLSLIHIYYIFCLSVNASCSSSVTVEFPARLVLSLIHIYFAVRQQDALQNERGSHAAAADADADSAASAAADSSINAAQTTVKVYYSRSSESARDAARFTNSNAYDTMPGILSECDMIFLTVPDGNIKAVWKELSGYNVTGKLICHCSGAMSSREAVSYTHLDVYKRQVRYGDAGCQPSAFFGQCEKRVLVGQSECHQSGD